MLCPSCGVDSSASDHVCPHCLTRVIPTGDPTEAPTRWPSDPTEATTGVPGAARSSRGALMQPGQAFGPRYRISRVLGEGGMGAVYEAQDLELGVPVAVKVIRPEITADPTAARDIELRFKRELLLARQVTHPNVVRIHDLGDVEGVKYISMSYIDGVDLATLLARDGPLPVGRALGIARSIAAGLAAAHRAGVVHRDLKPGNVMIEQSGQALIMDFGIARSHGTVEAGARPPTAAPPSTLINTTQAGAIVGTIPYMAPEQASGGDVDQRADLYSFGLIVYDMLTPARRARIAKGAFTELMARKESAPEPLAAVQPGLPPALERVIMRCLAPQPDDRYQSMDALVADLDALDEEGNPLPVVRRVTRRQLGAAAAGVLALLTGTCWFARPGPAPVQPPIMSMLIADFDNQTGDAAFGEVAEQAAIVAFEGAPFLTNFDRFRARRLVTQASLGPSLTTDAARLLALREGITIVIAGALAGRGNGFSVTLQAVDPETGAVRAEGEATARDRAGVLQAVAEAASDIRGALGDTTAEDVRLRDAETFTSTSLEAVQAYVRGQQANAAADRPGAIKAWQEAVSIDPQFGRAYINLALVYSNLKQEVPARTNYEAALKTLDRMTPREKYRSLGVYYLGATKNFESARDQYESLVREYPSDNMGYANLALAYVYLRDLPKAKENGRKAVAIYPRNLLQRTNYATYAMYAGEFATAIAEAQSVLKENPAYEWAGQTLAIATLASGDDRGARDAFARLAEMNRTGWSLSRLGEADLEMYYGRYPRAIALLQEAIARDQPDAEAANSLALEYVALAEAQLAIGQRGAAAASARRATALADAGGVYLPESVYYPAAHVLLQAGDQNGARTAAARLAQALTAPPRSYALLIEGEIAMAAGRIVEALDRFREAQKLHDSWLVHARLGAAYAAAKQPVETLSEWESCLNRIGESTDVFIADTATLRYLTPVYYWLGRSLEAVGSTDGARTNFERYVALRGVASPADPLAADARRRLESLRRQ